MDPSTETLYTLLKEVFLLLDDGDRRLFSSYGLSEARFYALYHLGSQPGISSRELSDLMFCDKSNITRLIKGMEAEGLVQRQPHETDGRALRLFLTAEGAAIQQEAIAAHQIYNRTRLDHCLSDTARGDLYAELLSLRDGLYDQLYQANGHNKSLD